jgi:hypothetical protein
MKGEIFIPTQIDYIQFEDAVMSVRRYQVLLYIHVCIQT